PQDVTLQVRGDGNPRGFCATFPTEQLKATKRGLSLKHPKHALGSAKGITAFSLRMQETGDVVIRIQGARTTLPTPASGSVHLTWVLGGPSPQCATSRAQLRGVAHGGLRFP